MIFHTKTLYTLKKRKLKEDPAQTHTHTHKKQTNNNNSVKAQKEILKIRKREKNKMIYYPKKTYTHKKRKPKRKPCTHLRIYVRTPEKSAQHPPTKQQTIVQCAQNKNKKTHIYTSKQTCARTSL